MKTLLIALLFSTVFNQSFATEQVSSTRTISSDQLSPEVLAKIKSGKLSQAELQKLLASHLEEKKPAKQLTAKKITHNFGQFSVVANEGADIDDAVSEIGYAYSRFNYLFGDAPHLTVVLENAVNGVASINIPKDNANYMPYISGIAGKKALSHEVCHMLLSLQPPKAKRSKANPIKSYGHSLLPDWFDETVAVSCELPNLQNKRVAKYHEQALGFDWASYLTQEHPLMGKNSKFAQQFIQPEQTKKTAAGKGKAKVKFLTGDQLNEYQDEIDNSVKFYYRASVIGRALEQTIGQGVFKEIADALFKQQTFEQWLANTQIKDLSQLETIINRP